MMERYIRQTSLEEIGHEGQKRLSEAKVLIVGVGGLGSPAAMYLAAAGIGCIGLIDTDTVSLSNLQRQIMYAEGDIGRPKAEVAAARLKAMNSDIRVEPMTYSLTEDNALETIRRFDVIVDGCDNFQTRHLMDRTCLALGKTYIYGAIQGFEGQVSVFTPETARYGDLFGISSGNAAAPAVVGMSAGVVASVMAHEVIKVVCGYGDILKNRLWTMDLLSMKCNLIEL